MAPDAALLLAAAPALVFAQATPVGVWKTIDDKTKSERALVRVTESGGVFVGRIEKLLAAEFNRDGHAIVDHRTYAFLGDGCLMEGISHEACALAGAWKLNKLVALYDDNGISIDGQVKPWFVDDVAARFRAYQWHVVGPVDGHDVEALDAAIARFEPVSPHHGRAMAVTVTQATEVGTVYSLAELDEIAAVAKSRNLPLHMDGARFANALVSLGVTPAEMTWKRGVDILSFGGTKNGCWCAEAIVFMKPEMAEEMPYIRKRSAQLFSKTRFISAQLEAYLEGDLWLDLARHSNAMADRLRAGLTAKNTARLAWATQANEVFAVIDKSSADRAQSKGAKFYDWLAPRDMPHMIRENERLVRLVTSFSTTQEEVDQFIEVV